MNWGFVYFVQAGEEGRIKIGSAVNPPARIKELQTGCPETLDLLGVMPSYTFREDENRLHKRFEKHRVGGEWFNPDDEIIEHIDLYTEDYETIVNDYGSVEVFWREIGRIEGYREGMESMKRMMCRKINTYFGDNEDSLIEFCSMTKIPVSDILDTRPIRMSDVKDKVQCQSE